MFKWVNHLEADTFHGHVELSEGISRYWLATVLFFLAAPMISDFTSIIWINSMNLLCRTSPMDISSHLCILGKTRGQPLSPWANWIWPEMIFIVVVLVRMGNCLSSCCYWFYGKLHRQVIVSTCYHHNLQGSEPIPSLSHFFGRATVPKTPLGFWELKKYVLEEQSPCQFLSVTDPMFRSSIPRFSNV